MGTLRIYDLLGQRLLLSRASARLIQPNLAAVLSDGHGEVELDLSGIEGLAPSFWDEVLTIIEEQLREAGTTALRLAVKHPPTHLSSKFRAIGRVHSLSIAEANDSWVISKS